jgi:GT2 family glycosyltransferase
MLYRKASLVKRRRPQGKVFLARVLQVPQDRGPLRRPFGSGHVADRDVRIGFANGRNRLPEAAMITVSIPVLNNWELTRDCLTSLAEHSRGHDLEVVVVDNGSSDETASQCRPLGESLFGGRFRCLRQERNLNFGPASNLGARMGTGEFVLFLNNDTISTPGWLDPLVDALESDGRLGAVGPVLMYPGKDGDVDRIQHLGLAFEPQHYPAHLYEFFPADHPLARRRRKFQALTGAALMMPRSVFEAAGGFHEEYINGGEDVDLSLQIAKMGLELACVPESRIYHLASMTPGRNDAEAHNARVLKTRCMDLICPDMHLIAAAEGYEVRLTKWLRPYLALPERRRTLIEKRTDANDMQSLEEALQREPLWHEGRSLAVDAGRATGDFTAAARHAFLMTKFRCSPGAFRVLLETAKENGDEALAEYARAHLSRYEPFDVLVRERGGPSARFMADYMSKLGETRLAGLYRKWLVDHGESIASPSVLSPVMRP